MLLYANIIFNHYLSWGMIKQKLEPIYFLSILFEAEPKLPDAYIKKGG